MAFVLFGEKYFMKNYEFEILCQLIVKGDRYEMSIAEPSGYYFNGGKKKYKYPECLFFCPVTGPERNNMRTGKVLRKIISYQILSADEIITAGGDRAKYFSDVHCKHHPSDRTNNRVHTFELINFIKIPEKNQRFSGSASFYKDIADLLSIEKL